MNVRLIIYTEAKNIRKKITIKSKYPITEMRQSSCMTYLKAVIIQLGKGNIKCV